MATVVRVVALMWVDIVAVYAMYVMMAYLTNVWKLGFTRAAAIVNVFWGVVSIQPLPLTYLAETIIGNYWILLLSTFSYSAGLGFLAMSTPTGLGRAMGNCREYKPECISQGQKVLFYTALPLIAFGMSGHMTSWNSFMAEQLVQQENDDGFHLENNEDQQRTFWKFFYGMLVTILFTFVAVFGLPYIKPWSLRFGIPAICTLVSTLLFLSGSCSYKYAKPQGSPLTAVVRVFVAAVLKLFHRIPRDPKELFELHHPQIYVTPHTKSLRCLDKAAIVLPTEPLAEQAKKMWRLCTVTEVEETKAIIRMLPVWTTFILCGVVSAIGFTYFIEQLDHLNHKVGRLKLPSVALLLFFDQAQNQSTKLYSMLANRLARSGKRNLAPPIGITVSMILAILCCITAAKVENRRLAVVQKHGLVEKPDETVPMSMFWLLPQFALLGAFRGIFDYSSICFFVDQSPPTTQRYFRILINAVFGVGILSSVASVYVVGKVSERGGKMNWFQHDLNGSRLDKYYWSLSWLMGVNLLVFIVVAILYRYKESELQEQQAVEFGGMGEGFDENAKCICCFC
ncbi:hypothetical protein C2S53_013421 [Perilla frutescens var. hirtella]|uniref:Protein NRT1/ PTR FAMILY 5.5-like n=1 Tax=Perilla frutescens var. hirtella TaxID=608512 RepID=A0AAD4JN83_PERFH|nr:hypothetical protein C2S51_009040 [Perilla frutescens var. frutescens]KAH6836945.1 hypothetical protein C2S53_013421 [Perilla frutescens var. hirtella]